VEWKRTTMQQWCNTDKNKSISWVTLTVTFLTLDLSLKITQLKVFAQINYSFSVTQPWTFINKCRSFNKNSKIFITCNLGMKNTYHDAGTCQRNCQCKQSYRHMLYACPTHDLTLWCRNFIFGAGIKPPPRSTLMAVRPFKGLTARHIYIYTHTHTGCPRRNVQDFGRVFLMLKYTDITQNTYIQSWTVTGIMAREVWNFDSSYTLIDYQIHIKTGRNMCFL